MRKLVILNNNINQKQNTMKKYLSFLMALLVGVVLQAQVTSYPWTLEFDGTLDAWTAVDADGDGHGWEVYNGYPSSFSYDNDTYEAYTPDNWLYLNEEFALPAGMDLNLSWVMTPHCSGYYAGDYYSVYLITESGDSVLLHSELLSGQSSQSVSLAEYAGQTVQVAFRHHNCTDMCGLSLQALSIMAYEPPATEIAEFPYTADFFAHWNEWTTLDEDGDGNTWKNSGNSALSYSYLGGDLTPDNYLISLPINVPATGELALTWTMAPQSSYYEEQYSVMASTGGADAADFTDVLYNKTFAEGVGETQSVSLADYAGQTIRIAFRHHDCTGQYWLTLTDVSIQYNSSTDTTVVTPTTHTVTVSNPDDGYVYYRSYDADGNSFGQGRIHGTVNVVLNSGEYVCIDFGDADPQMQPNIGVGYENALVASVKLNGIELPLNDSNFSITDQWENYGYRLYSICHINETDATFDVSFTALPVDTTQFNLTAINNGGGYFRYINDEGSQIAIPNTSYYNLAEGESMNFTMGSFSSVFEDVYGYKAAPDSAARLLHFYLDGVDMMDQLDEFNWSDQGYTFYNYVFTATNSNMHTIEAVYGPYFEEDVCEAASHLKVSLSNEAAHLSWMPASNADEGYIVWVSGDDTYFPVYSNSTDTWIDGLQPSTSYTVKVTSLCNGDTLYSDPITFTTLGNQGNINLTTNGGRLYSEYFQQVLDAGTYTMTGFGGVSTMIRLLEYTAELADQIGVNKAFRLIESVTIDGEEILLDGSDPRVTNIYNGWNGNGYNSYEIYLPFPDGGESYVNVVFTGDSDTSVVTPTTHTITVNNPDGGYMWTAYAYVGQIFADGYSTTLDEGDCITVRVADINTMARPDLNIPVEIALVDYVTINGETIDLLNDERVVYTDMWDEYGARAYDITLCDLTEDVELVAHYKAGVVDTAYLDTVSLTVHNVGGGYLTYFGDYDYSTGNNQYSILSTFYTNLAVGESITFGMASFDPDGTNGSYVDASAGMLKQVLLDGENIPIDAEHMVLYNDLDDYGYVFYNYTYTQEDEEQHELQFIYGVYNFDSLPIEIVEPTIYTLTTINNGGGNMVLNNEEMIPADTSTYSFSAGSSATLYFSTDSPESEYYEFPEATQLDHLYLDGVEIDLSVSNGALTVYDYMDEENYIYYALNISMDADHTVEAVFGPWTGGIVDTTVVQDTTTYTVTLSNPDEGYMWNENSGRIFADGYSTTLSGEDCITIEIADINTVKQPNVNIPVEVALVDYVTINGETIDLLNDSRVEFTDLWDQYGYRIYDITLCNLTEDVELIAHYKAGEVDTAYLDTVSLTVQNVGGGYLTYISNNSQYSISNTFYANLSAGESITFCMASFDPDGANGNLVPASAGMLKQVLLDGESIPIDDEHMVLYNHLSDGMGYIFYNYTYTQEDEEQHELQFIYGEYVADSLPIIPEQPTTKTFTFVNSGNGYMDYYVDDNNTAQVANGTSTHTFNATDEVQVGMYSFDTNSSVTPTGITGTTLQAVYLDGEQMDLDELDQYPNTEYGYTMYNLVLSDELDHTILAIYSGGNDTTVVQDTSFHTITLINTGNGLMVYDDEDSEEGEPDFITGTTTHSIQGGHYFIVEFADVEDGSEFAEEMKEYTGIEQSHLQAIKLNGVDVPLTSSTILDVEQEEGVTIYVLTLMADKDYTIEGIFGNEPNPGDDTTLYTVNVISVDTLIGIPYGGGSYYKGDTITIGVVMQDSTYTFKQWQDGDTLNPRTVVVTGNLTFIASFQHVGIADVQGTMHIEVYPNPATTQVTLDGVEVGSSITIVDFNGRMVQQLQATTPVVDVDLSTFARGTYFVRVQNGRSVTTAKLLVR